MQMYICIEYDSWKKELPKYLTLFKIDPLKVKRVNG